MARMIDADELFKNIIGLMIKKNEQFHASKNADIDAFQSSNHIEDDGEAYDRWKEDADAQRNFREAGAELDTYKAAIIEVLRFIE